MTRSNASSICYLGLGSNQGNKIQNLNQAIQHLSHLPHTHFIASASLYVSKAWGVTEQDDFLNTVVKIRTKLKPLALLKAIKKIEYQHMNRPLNQRWHQRNIDIDILLYGQTRMNRCDLTIPHQYLTERCFVIKPLLELKPKLPSTLSQKISLFLAHNDCETELKVTNRRNLNRIYR